LYGTEKLQINISSTEARKTWVWNDINVKIRAVKRLIASKIKVYVYI